MSDKLFDDLDALTEAFLEGGGESFHDLTRAIRFEMCQPARPGCGLKDAMYYAENSLARLKSNEKAQAMLKRWREFRAARCV